MSQIIPFIHNYCDRWCERCEFVSRCSVGLSSKDSTHTRSTEFWDELGDNMDKAAKMLKEAMEKHGIKAESITDEDKMETEIKQLLTESNPLVQLAEIYAKLVNQFFEFYGDKASVLSVSDCVGVVKWYQYFIQVKLSRALSELSENLDYESGFQTDYNGSAKIALLSVKFSIESWTTIYAASADNLILVMLIALDKLKKSILEAFPDCEKFKRPGFDD
jgi:hypothetical protein